MNPTSIDLLLTLMIQMLNRAGEFAALITKARSEGRDVTEAELDALAANDNLMRDQLQQAINEAKAKP